MANVNKVFQDGKNFVFQDGINYIFLIIKEGFLKPIARIMNIKPLGKTTSIDLTSKTINIKPLGKTIQ